MRIQKSKLADLQFSGYSENMDKLVMLGGLLEQGLSCLILGGDSICTGPLCMHISICGRSLAIEGSLATQATEPHLAQRC